MTRFYRVLKAIVRPLCFVLFPYRFEHRENIPSSGPFVICSNHISYIDPVYLALAVDGRQVFYMAKGELFRFRPFGWLLRRLGAFPVERGKGDGEAMNVGYEHLKNGQIMGIFPEGTRSKNGKLGRAKSGVAVIAARAGVPVVPAAIKVKNGKVRLFRRAVFEFAAPISPEQMKPTGEGRLNEYRAVVQRIMEPIACMLGEKEAGA